MTKRINCLLALSTMLGIVGCGSRATETRLRRAYASRDEARKAFDAGDYATAASLFAECIEGGGLQADILAEAYLQRGLAQVELGNLDAASADFDLAEQGGVAAVSLHQARAAYYLKRGDQAQANAELASARRLDRSLASARGKR